MKTGRTKTTLLETESHRETNNIISSPHRSSQANVQQSCYRKQFAAMFAVMTPNSVGFVGLKHSLRAHRPSVGCCRWPSIEGREHHQTGTVWIRRHVNGMLHVCQPRP